jgi:uncharacterized Zn finger protein
MKKCQCSQCGSTEFQKERTEFLRCSHCGSLFRMIPHEKPQEGNKFIIKKGAKVIFGANSKVVIKGELIIEDGASVSFLGELEVIEVASAENIAKAREHLKHIP